MPDCITNTHIRSRHLRILLGLFILVVSGCKVTKNYPLNQPFVYKTTIKLDTKLTQSERQKLLNKLENQLDDSIQATWVSKLFIKKILNKPPVFDTVNAIKSEHYLKDLLHANGFLYNSVEWDSSMVQVRDEQRVTVNFKVKAGSPMKFDSIGFSLRDSILQGLALKNRKESLLKKGDYYSKDKIAQEMDRILTIYRNNGYLKINRDDIYAEVDTVVAGLIDPGLDPFEQIRLLQEVQKRRENPTIDVVIRQRGADTNPPLHQYHIRQVRIYPDLLLVLDSLPKKIDTVSYAGVSILSSRDLFKHSFLLKNNSLLPGALYRQKDIYRTNNVFGRMSAWQQVGIEILPIDSLHQVDLNINMYPSKKQSLSADLEASRNASDVVTTGNLFGLGINFGLLNRNVRKQSIQSNTNLRFGIELGNKGTIIQTYQTTLSQNFGIPKFVTPFKIKSEKNLLSARTNLNANASYIIRRDYYTIKTLATSISYEWTNQKKRNWLYSPLNIELTKKLEYDSFKALKLRIPNLENSFNDGLIISQFLRYNYSWGWTNKGMALRIGGEESGGIFGMIKSLDLKQKLFRYVRADIDLRYYVTHPRHSWAFRIFGGVGVPYGKMLDSLGNVGKELTLPFFKSYFAGGPISMRAWQIRQLGPGSSLVLDSTNIDRFGDIQLETNVEYRFPLGTLFGIKIKSAFFADVGNIWYRNNQGDPALDEAVFKLNRLYHDIAVAGGTSLRMDFNYFLIRFDWAYKLKNPVYADINDGWFQNLKLAKGQFQLGINYPF